MDYTPGKKSEPRTYGTPPLQAEAPRRPDTGAEGTAAESGSTVVRALVAAVLGYLASILIMPTLARLTGAGTSATPGMLEFVLGLLPMDIAAAACAAAVVLHEQQRFSITDKVDPIDRVDFMETPRDTIAAISIPMRLKLWATTIPAAILVVSMVTAITFKIFTLLDLKIQPPPMQEFMQNIEFGSGLWIMVAVASVVLAPVAEEFLFRFVLPTALGHLGLVVPWATAAVLFAVAHGSIMSIPGLFALALILNHIVKQRGTLLDAMIIHAGYNASILILWLLFRNG
jgi:membrane protease YdiL (CAAX protease family)